MKTKLIFGLAASVLIITGFKEKPKNLFKLKKGFTENFAYIPNGSIDLEQKRVETAAFYMSKKEVTNAQYQEFLSSLSDEKKVVYEIKSQNWSKALESEKPYSEHYHIHPSFALYPVVNVTKKGAEAYCVWLTEEYDKMDIGLPEGYKVEFRLPTRSEWVFAANGELQGSYSWGGPYLRNTKGQFLANFVRIGPENVHENPETGEYEIMVKSLYYATAGNLNEMVEILAPADSYAPNRYGLVNMNGNAAELLADTDQAAGGSWRCPGYDIRNKSLMSFKEASPEVGFRPIGVITKTN